MSGYSLIDTGTQVNAINDVFLESANLNYDKGRFVQIAGAFGMERRYTYKEIPVNIFASTVNLEENHLKSRSILRGLRKYSA